MVIVMVKVVSVGCSKVHQLQCCSPETWRFYTGTMKISPLRETDFHEHLWIGAYVLEATFVVFCLLHMVIFHSYDKKPEE